MRTERTVRLVPDPNNPGEMIKEIKISKTCGCTSRIGRNGNSLKLNTHFEYKDTFTEEARSGCSAPLKA